MKKLLLFLAVLVTMTCAWADDLDALQGKWTVKKTGDRGPYTQQIEFKKNKWTFKILGSDDRVAFAAEGEIELKKMGPFNTARFFKIKAGRVETALEPTDEERNSIYLLDNGQLFVASNFDRPRENERPGVDAYSKAN